MGTGASVVGGTETERDGTGAATAQRQRLPQPRGPAEKRRRHSAHLRRGDGPTPSGAAATPRAAHGGARPRSGLPPRRDNGRHGGSVATELCRRPRASGRAQMATQHGRFSACAGAAPSGLSLPSDTVLLWLLLCFCFCTLLKISAETQSGAASAWGAGTARCSAGTALGAALRGEAVLPPVASPRPRRGTGNTLQLPLLPSASLWPREDQGWKLVGMARHSAAQRGTA